MIASTERMASRSGVLRSPYKGLVAFESADAPFFFGRARASGCTTTLLAQEGFGQGRHSASGAMRAQDFSFGYEVLPVAACAPRRRRQP